MGNQNHDKIRKLLNFTFWGLEGTIIGAPIPTSPHKIVTIKKLSHAIFFLVSFFAIYFRTILFPFVENSLTIAKKSPVY